MKAYPSVLYSFFSRVIFTDTCWKWNGSKDRLGRGKFFCRGESIPAHVWLYGHVYGDTTRKEVVTTTCGTIDCIRPSHLVKMSKSDHMKLSLSRYSHTCSITRRTHEWSWQVFRVYAHSKAELDRKAVHKILALASYENDGAFDGCSTDQDYLDVFLSEGGRYKITYQTTPK